MEKFEIQLDFLGHITKNFVRFECGADVGRIPIRTVYISRDAVGEPIPETIKITVEVPQLPVLDI